MNNRIAILVSRCLSPGPEYRFHFKGFLMGKKIKEVLIHGDGGWDFEKGEDYYLKIRVESVVLGILRAKALRARKLDNAKDDLWR